MANNNYTNKIGIETSEAQRGLKEINASLKDLKASVQYVTVASKDYNSKLVLLNKIIDENVDKEKLLEKEYNKLANAKGADLIATTKAHEALEKQRTATALAREDLKKFKEAHEKASKAEDIHTVKLDYLSRAIYDLTKALAEKACKALVDFTKETINTGMQFESAFAGVRKVTSGTEEDFKNLENEIRKTALEKPISADQLASIYQMGSQLGIAKDGLKDFSNAIIDLAKTSDLTEEAGATMIAQYANVTGLEEDEYRKFASTLSYLGSTTATTESTIMDFASRISGSAKLIGMSHQEILALSTALGSVGIKAEMGGSAISKIMNSIDVAVDKNSEELQTWAQVAGVSSSEFASKWKTNVASAFQDVIVGMTKFKDEGGSLNLLLEELDIKNIRQTETLKKLANASELLAEDMSKANEEWEKAAFLGESAGQVYNTVESKMQLLKNSFSELQISIYEGIKEPLAEAAEELSKFLQSDDAKKFAEEFSNALKGAIKIATELIKALVKNFDKVVAVAKTVASAMAGIVAAKITKGFITLGTNIKNCAKMIGDFVTKLFTAKVEETALTAATEGATVAQHGLNAAMAANPIGALCTAIGMLISAIVMFALNTGSATDKTKEHINALEEERKQLVENREEREKTVAGIDAEAAKTQGLVDELKTLVDENGRVKDGYKTRFDEIVPLIEKATGVEIRCIDGQIQKYGELVTAIDRAIKKKRLESKLRTYQDAYDEAISNEETNKQNVEDKKKEIDKLRKKLTEEAKNDYEVTEGARDYKVKKRKHTGEYDRLEKQIKEAEKELEVLTTQQENYNDVIKKYEDLVIEEANFNKDEDAEKNIDELIKKEKDLKKVAESVRDAFNKGSKDVTYSMVENAEKALTDIQDKIKKMQEFANGKSGASGSVGTGGSGVGTGGKSSGSKSSSKKEETHTSYQELLNLEKAYETQLQNYLTAIKQGNSEITVEMVQDTKKKLDEVQKKVKDMKQLLGESTSNPLSLPDESYGTLEKKRKELKAQYSQMMSDLANGNKNITEDMLKNVTMQVDQVEAKIKNLKNEWNEDLNGEISDEFESENANHQSKGVIYGKGVIGENAVEMIGAGKDAAASYLDAYEAEKERRNNELVVQAKNQAQQEALSYQEATVDPNNLAVYDITEKQLAESKQTSQAQGLADNAYKVIDAETWTLNQAINAAMQIDFTQIGKYMCDGIANGIRENAHVVVGAVRAMMAEANSTAADEEEEHSPSKVFYRFGKFMDLGMANGIRDYAKFVSNQVREMTSRANEAISLANNQISAERFGNVNALRGAGNTEINYNFTQNNTSNKSLDTLAIYQESKSMLKRAIRNQYV